MDPEQLARALRAGSRRALAKAITLVESSRPEHRSAAVELMRACKSDAAASLRLGVTGPPGVGKSTLIAALAKHWVAAGRHPAMLLYDPSSQRGGSVLADKTRMSALLGDASVFIRPSPTAQGSVGSAAYQSALLCEAAGYSPVIVETVGVGQSELLVLDVADLVLLLVQPNAGDELQAMKRGILEHADAIAVTKSDGELASAAQRARSELEVVESWLRPDRAKRRPIFSVSADTGAQVEALVGTLDALFLERSSQAGLGARRAERQRLRFRSGLSEQVSQRVLSRPEVARQVERLEAQIASGELSVEEALEACDRVLFL